MMFFVEVVEGKQILFFTFQVTFHRNTNVIKNLFTKAQNFIVYLNLKMIRNCSIFKGPFNLSNETSKFTFNFNEKHSVFNFFNVIVIQIYKYSCCSYVIKNKFSLEYS